MKMLWELYIAFFKIGMSTFGGGYAMLPIIQREIIEDRGWSTEEEFMDYYAIGQCTPGIIAVNTSTFVGYKQKGVLGGIVATLGFVTPSIIIITIISAVLRNFADLAVVQNAFAGIRACVCVLFVNTVVKLFKNSIVDKPTLLIFVLVTSLSLFFSTSPVVLVLASAVAGIAISTFRARYAVKELADENAATSSGHVDVRACDMAAGDTGARDAGADVEAACDSVAADTHGMAAYEGARDMTDARACDMAAGDTGARDVGADVEAACDSVAADTHDTAACEGARDMTDVRSCGETPDVKTSAHDAKGGEH